MNCPGCGQNFSKFPQINGESPAEGSVFFCQGCAVFLTVVKGIAQLYNGPVNEFVRWTRDCYVQFVRTKAGNSGIMN